MDELDKVLEGIKQKEVDLCVQIVNLQVYANDLKSELHDCVNDLCLRCGNYHEEHNGACDDCRWLKPRRGW